MSKRRTFLEGKARLEEAAERGAGQHDINRILMTYGAKLPVREATALVDYADELRGDQRGLNA